jgi:hypothetical protein
MSGAVLEDAMGFKLPLSLVRPKPPPPPPKPALKVASTPPQPAKAATTASGYSGTSSFEATAAPGPTTPASTPSGFSGTLSRVLQGVSGLVSGGASFLSGAVDFGKGAVEAARESLAVSKLPPDQQKAYLQTKAALGPEDQATLRDLLLTQPEVLFATDPATGRTTLDALSDLAAPGAQGKVEGAAPAQVLSQTVRDLADPTAMDQGDDSLCGTLSIQQQMAQTNPAGYASFMSQLALNGTATTASGVTFTLPDRTSVDPARSSTQQLMGQAIFAAQNNPDNPNYVYDNEGNGTAQSGYNRFLEENGADPAQAKHGISLGDQAWAQWALLGGNYKGQVIPAGEDNAAGQASAKQTLIDQAGQGKPASVLLSPGQGPAHWVTVTGVDADANTITYVDDGVVKTEDLDQFLAGSAPGPDGQPAHPAVEALTYDADLEPEGQPPAQFQGWYSDDGGGHSLGTGTSPTSQGGTVEK